MNHHGRDHLRHAGRACPTEPTSVVNMLGGVSRCNRPSGAFGLLGNESGEFVDLSMLRDDLTPGRLSATIHRTPSRSSGVSGTAGDLSRAIRLFSGGKRAVRLVNREAGRARAPTPNVERESTARTEARRTRPGRRCQKVAEWRCVGAADPRIPERGNPCRPLKAPIPAPR